MASSLKEQRLTSWQSMAHQIMGQLLMANYLKPMSMEMVDRSILPKKGDRDRLLTMLIVYHRCVVHKQRRTHSQSLCLEAEALTRLSCNLGQTIRVGHILGKRNVIADALSHPDSILGTEWSLSTQP